MHAEIEPAELIKSYHAWDRSVRIFHWINVLCVIGLVGVGLVILNSKALGVSTDGKIILKTIHVYTGYAFVLNLLWRIIWGFIGTRYSRWRAILPMGRAYRSALGLYLHGLKTGQPPGFLGHNPVARMMVTLLFLLLSAQAATGLVLAGTDLYLPPFGKSIAAWVSEDPAGAAAIKPYSKEGVNADSYQAMRDFRKPFITLHVYTFYTLLVAILLHIGGVVYSELREKSGLISAMFTGRKFFTEEPADNDGHSP